MQTDPLISTVPAEFILAGIWQGLLVTSAAWLALEALPQATSRVTSRIRFVLWMIVFLAAALVPFSILAHRLPAAAAISASPTTALLPAVHFPASWAVILAGLWVLASLFALAQLARNAFRLHRISRSVVPLPAEMLDAELQRLVTKADSRPVPVCFSNRVDSPMAIGFFRPAIVIPQWLERKLSPSELRQIVMHEIAHLERRDDWTNLLQKLLRALFPLNPALLWAERQLCRERERACDDRVLDATGSPRDYAACLASLAEKRLLRGVPTLAPGAWQRRSELAERVYRILRHKSEPGHAGLGSRGASAVVGTFLAACLCASAALARCPQFVTFTEQASQPRSEPASLIKSPAPQVRKASLELSNAAAPHVEEAVLHSVVPAHKTRMASRHHHTQRLPRLIPSRFDPSRLQTRIILTVWEISPTSADAPVADFQSHSDWIIFEL